MKMHKHKYKSYGCILSIWVGYFICLSILGTGCATRRALTHRDAENSSWENLVGEEIGKTVIVTSTGGRKTKGTLSSIENDQISICKWRTGELVVFNRLDVIEIEIVTLHSTLTVISFLTIGIVGWIAYAFSSGGSWFGS